MERRNMQRLVERMRNRGKAGGGDAPAPRKKLGKWAGWAVFGLVALILCSLAFSGSKGLGNASLEPAVGAVPAAMPTPAVAGFALDLMPGSTANGATTGQFTYNAYDASGNALKSMVAPNPAIQLGAPASGGASQTQTQATPWDRMIIRTATLQLTVKDVASSVDVVRRLASLHGGYVFQSDSHQDGDYTVASITIQVPSQEFDKVMPELRKLDGQVKKIGQENVTSSDVTEEYTDLQSQLRNLQATEARLLALQQKADKLEDILTLDQQLRQVQGDIERIQGRLNFLSKRSEMSSITVNLAPEKLPEPTPTPEPVSGWQPGEIAQKAWFASLDMLASAGTVAITLAVFLWWTTPLILLVAWLALRARRRPTADTPTTPGMPSNPAAPAGEPSVL